MKFYSITYAHGIAVNANTGKPYATIIQHDSREARDLHVESGGDFTTSDDWRESILASDSFVRWSMANEYAEDVHGYTIYK